MYTIETVIFKATGRTMQITYPNQWEKLLEGFVNSANKNTSGKVIVHRIDRLRADKRTELCVNHYKLKKWRDIVHQAKDPIVLCDTDICFLDDIADGFTDMPITLTSRAERWCNAGVVFVRPCQEARDFFDKWCEMDDWLHQGKTDIRGNPLRLKQAWKKTNVPGHNQTALALIKHSFNFGWVSGALYNASMKQEWMGNPKIVHVKDSMRRDVMRSAGGRQPQYELAKKIIKYYY